MLSECGMAAVGNERREPASRASTSRYAIAPSSPFHLDNLRKLRPLRLVRMPTLPRGIYYDGRRKVL